MSHEGRSDILLRTKYSPTPLVLHVDNVSYAWYNSYMTSANNCFILLGILGMDKHTLKCLVIEDNLDSLLHQLHLCVCNTKTHA